MFEVVKVCLFLTNRATQDSTILGCPKPFLVEIAFSGILLCISISRKLPQFREGSCYGASGYTLSTTILHYNIWKRRRSFLGLSECRGFIEVLYASIFTLMHADACICIATEDPLHGFHPSACNEREDGGNPVHVHTDGCRLNSSG